MPSVFNAVALLSTILLPAFGLYFGWKATRAVSERRQVDDDWTIRGNVILRPFVGMSMVIAVAIALGFLVGTILSAPIAGFPTLHMLASVYLSTVLFGIVYVALGLAIATAIASHRWTAIYLTGMYVLTTVGWTALIVQLRRITGSGSGGTTAGRPSAVSAAERLDPTGAYQSAVAHVTTEPSIGFTPSNVDAGTAMTIGWVSTAWFGVIVLVGWVTFCLVFAAIFEGR